MKAKEIAIKGKVHDVGYRLFLLSLQNRIIHRELLLNQWKLRIMDKRGDHFMGIKATLEKVTEKVGVD